VGNPEQYNRIKTLPNAQTHSLGTMDGGYSAFTDRRTVDIEKFMGSALTIPQSTVRNQGDAAVYLEYPGVVNGALLPSQVIVVQTPAPGAQSFFVRYDWTYHCEFSELRPLGTTIAQADIGHVWNPSL